MSMANKDLSYFRQQPKKHENARCQKNIVEAAIEESMTFGFHQGVCFCLRRLITYIYPITTAIVTYTLNMTIPTETN